MDYLGSSDDYISPIASSMGKYCLKRTALVHPNRASVWGSGLIRVRVSSFVSDDYPYGSLILPVPCAFPSKKKILFLDSEYRLVDIEIFAYYLMLYPDGTVACCR